MRVLTRARLLLAAVALSPLLVPLSTSEAADDCFWRSRSNPQGGGVAYPDEFATYWLLEAALPPGAALELKGSYPRTRYASFNAYDAALRPVDALADVDIKPDAGSTNTFRTGARRDAKQRSYTLSVVADSVPATRAPNTLYNGVAGVPNPLVTMLYRTYVPDRGLGPDGGVGLPQVAVVLADGTRLEGEDACTVGRENNRPDPVPGLDGPDGVQGAATNPVTWHRFTDAPSAVVDPVIDVVAGPEGESPLPRTGGGGYLSNRDNAYVLATADRANGRVLVITGKAPTVPRTLAGPRVMPRGQLRYWSFCTNEQASTRFYDCAYDEQVPLDREGRYTVVVSTPADRPATATAACGVSWLAWGPQPQALVILRHMLPDPGFAEAIQRAQPERERTTMRDYLPVGTHTTTAGFRSPRCR